MKHHILFDFNNLAMRVLHLPQVGVLTGNPSFNFWDYLVFNHIYDFALTVARSPEDTVEIYLIMDGGGGYWRKEIYPQYKEDRKEKRDKDNINWGAVFANFEKFVVDAHNSFPWHTLKVPKCEADDVIYVLSQTLPSTDNVIVHSSDSDYVQCMTAPNINVFNPYKGEYVSLPGKVKVGSDKVHCDSWRDFLVYSLLTGQAGKDNVFNVKTPSDWQPTEDKKRRPPFGPKSAEKVWSKCGKDTNKLTSWLKENKLLENFLRNRDLIDLRCIPSNYKEDIVRTVALVGEKRTMRVDLNTFSEGRDWKDFDTFTSKEMIGRVLAKMASVEMVPLADSEVEDKEVSLLMEQQEEAANVDFVF